MKKNVVFIFLSLLSFNMKAQDMIITTEGNTLKVFDVDLSETSVFYRENAEESSPLKKMRKTDILMIKYQNGNKYIPNDSNTSDIPQQTHTSGEESTNHIIISKENLTAKELETNEKAITLLNSTPQLETKNNHLSDIGKKKASYAFAIFAATGNSIIENKDVEISFELGYIAKTKKKAEWTKDPFYGADEILSMNFNYTAIKYVIKNKSPKTLYLDLGNTFHIVGDRPTCFYIPSSTTTSQSNINGINANLGTIANGLGVGGIVGSLSQGVNVGSSSVTATTNTVYSQRIKAIPPMSTIELTPQYIYGENDATPSGFIQDIRKRLPYINFPKEKESQGLMFGHRFQYSETTSPIKVSLFLSFNSDEQSSVTYSMPATFYLKEIIGTKITGLGPSKTNWSKLSQNPHYIIIEIVDQPYRPAFQKK